MIALGNAAAIDSLSSALTPAFTPPAHTHLKPVPPPVAQAAAAADIFDASNGLTDATSARSDASTTTPQVPVPATSAAQSSDAHDAPRGDFPAPQYEIPSNLPFIALLAQQLASLATIVDAQHGPPPVSFPQQIAAAGSGGMYAGGYVPAAAANISQLQNTTITNPTITGGSIAAASITGTIGNAIQSALATINTLTATALTAARATTTSLVVTATTTTGDLRVSALDCSSFGNGGKLTTDAFGVVVCAADQGGAGSTVAGADTQVQFNNGGSFGASPSFTFSSTTGRLSVSYASTTGISTGYASSTSALVGSLSLSNLNGPLQANNGAVSATSSVGVLYGGTGLTNTPSYGNILMGNAGGGYTLIATSSLGLVAPTDLSAYLTVANWYSTTTDQLREGATNLYFSNARADARINATSSIGTITSAPSLGTLATSLTGLLKSTSGVLSAAAAGTDYQAPGNYLTALGSGYGTTSATAISFSTSTLSFNGLTFGTSVVPNAGALLFTPTISGTLANSGLANSTISGVALGGTLNNLSHNSTLSGTSYDGSASVSDWSLNLGNANAWTALQTFANASSTLFSAYGPAYFGATATSSFNSAGQLSIVSNGLTVGASQLVVSGGNVGIGTTSPAYMLTVSDGIRAGYINPNAGLDALVMGSLTNHPLILTTNDIERMRIDTSGNVGIGTTTPAARLDIDGGNSSDQIRLSQGGPSYMYKIGRNISTGLLDFNGTQTGNIGYTFSSGNVGIGTTTPKVLLEVQNSLDTRDIIHARVGNQYLTLGANSANSYSSIDAYNTTLGSKPLILNSSGGRVGIGTTGPGYQLDVYDNQPTTFVARIQNGGNATTAHGLYVQAGSNTAGGAVLVYFTRPDNSAIGSITQNGTAAVSYNTTSDRRVKENIATTTLGLDQLMRLPVREFDFINDPTHATTTGFIAQELEPVFPWAVTTNGDNGVVPLGASSTPWSVDYGRITPLIVKAVQDIANITGLFRANLIAWLGDTTNGLHDLFAGNIRAQDQLCVGDTCVTPAQFKAMVAAAAAAQTSSGTSTLSPPIATSSGDTAGPPQISVNGANPATISVGDTYADLGAVITGPDSDLNLGLTTLLDGATTTVISIDTTAAGSHTIEYRAYDQDDIMGTAARIVNVVASDTATSTPRETSNSTTTATSTAE